MNAGYDLSTRHLYLCTPDRPDLADFVAACIAGGVDVVQLRDKQLDARPLLARAAVVRETGGRSVRGEAAVAWPLRIGVAPVKRTLTRSVPGMAAR